MRHRQGFTLTELLVSMALIIFIMTILSEAFAAALESFRLMKAAGDMQERLRSVANVLRRDLQADHFTPDTDPLTSIVRTGRLSSLDLAVQSPPTAGGFFRIYQGSVPTYIQDMDGFYVGTATNQCLHFTINLRNTEY